MPTRDFRLMRRYWKEEPWGSFRDNVHAAIIAREIRRPQVRRGSKVNLTEFMWRNIFDVVAEANGKVSGLMKSIEGIATKMTRKEADAMARRQMKVRKRGKAKRSSKARRPARS